MRIRLPHPGWLILAALILTASGTVFHFWGKYRQAQALAEDVKRRGGTIRFAHAAPGWLFRLARDRKAFKYIEFLKTDVILLQLSDTNVDDAWLSRLPSMNRLSVLKLGNTRVTDAGIASLKLPARLVLVDLSGTAIGDPSLEVLAKSPELQFLNLSGTRVTDAGLAFLRDTKRLSSLDVSRTRITGTGLDVLKELPLLQNLNLEHTPVTAERLKHLETASAPQLRVSFHGTEITADDVDPLRKASYVRVQRWSDKSKVLQRLPGSILKMPGGGLVKGAPPVLTVGEKP